MKKLAEPTRESDPRRARESCGHLPGATPSILLARAG